VRDGYQPAPAGATLDTAEQRHPHSAPAARFKRPYHSLAPTQQWKRRKTLHTQVAAAAEKVGCPLEAILPQPRAAPEELLHLSTAERERIRSVPSLHIPCEQTMINCKQRLASTHATGTDTFVGGAEMTDPLAFVSVLCAQSSLLVVGGDAGGGRCVLGVTHSAAGKQHFAALLVYEGGDSWLELQDCRAEGLKKKGRREKRESSMQVIK